MTQLEERCLYIFLKIGLNNRYDEKHYKSFKKYMLSFRDHKNYLVPKDLRPYLGKGIIKENEIDEVMDRMCRNIYRTHSEHWKNWKLRHLKDVGKINWEEDGI